MGIRYYAYPLRPEHVEFAMQKPRAFVAPDPFADVWFDNRPHMLYLDKCWGLLQDLTRPDVDKVARPGYRLFEGNVTHTDCGWIPWSRALSPDDVRLIADDLSTISTEEVDRHFDPGPSNWPSDGSTAADYVRQYLLAAQEFTATMTAEGQGLVYMIG